MLNRKKTQVDFCVVGGGMAGICAAIAAARGGAKVVLMHERALLGGNASSEVRMWVCGAKGENNRESGIIEEIMLENLRRNPTKNYYIWDTVLYEFVKREPNITLLLNCTCMDAEFTLGEFEHGRDRRILGVTGYQMTTQTFFEVKADFFADCSGDSVLAPLVGASFRLGREAASEFGERTSAKVPDSKTMGMSCLIQARETTREAAFIPPDWAKKMTADDIKNRKPRLDRSSENFWYLELGGNRDSIADSEEVRDELIALALGMWDHIKNSGDYSAENWELDFLGHLPAKRESRRMVGEYMVNERDVSSERQYEDTVAYGGWPLDDHHPDGFYHRGQANTNFKTPSPYPLPYRTLYSKNVENLFFAGRNISMTHMAMSSTRVMATCALLGQAVGSAAALAVKYGITPHGIYLERIGELQEILMRADCFLPPLSRKVSELCRSTPVKVGKDLSDAVPIAEGDRLRDGRDRANRVYGTTESDVGVEVGSGESLIYDLGQPRKIGSAHIVFDSDLNRATLPGDNIERSHATRANTRLDSPINFAPPATLCREFSLSGITAEGEEVLLNVSNNARRAYDIELDREFLSLRLKVGGNWGNTSKVRVVSFDFT